MEQVIAYKDSNGRLYSSKHACIKAEFGLKLERAWGSMAGPAGEMGNPKAIANAISCGIYPLARKQLMDALDFLDAALSEPV